MPIDIAELKAAQDVLAAEKQELLDQYVIFRDALFQHLEHWTQQAARAGLDVEPGKRQARSAEYAEFSCSLFGTPLFFLADASFIGPIILGKVTVTRLQRAPLTARILVYPHTDADSLPEFDLQVYKAQDAYAFALFQRDNDYDPPQWHPLSDGYPDANGGREVANFFIEDAASYTSFWSVMPTLGAMQSGKQGKSPLGFTKPPKNARSDPSDITTIQ